MNTKKKILFLSIIIIILLLMHLNKDEYIMPAVKIRNRWDHQLLSSEYKSIRKLSRKHHISFEDWLEYEPPGSRRDNLRNQFTKLVDDLYKAYRLHHPHVDHPGKPRGLTAIVVPYRNRGANWLLFRDHMAVYLQMLSDMTGWGFEIFLVEQADTKPFNRALLFDVGLNYINTTYMGGYSFDCVVVHDVDWLPGPGTDYTKCEKPYHLTSALQTNNWGVSYREYFGGVTTMSIKDWSQVNGMAIDFWGWGSEDDELFHFVRQKGIVGNNPEEHRMAFGRFFNVHTRGSDMVGTGKGFRSREKAAKDISFVNRRLSDARYTLRSILHDDYVVSTLGKIFHQRVTWIQVEL